MALLLTIARLNFAIAAIYVCTRKVSYPLWVYLATALFCWWPLVIFSIQFSAERGEQTQAEMKRVAGKKPKLAVAVLLLSVGLQGVAVMLFGEVARTYAP